MKRENSCLVDYRAYSPVKSAKVTDVFAASIIRETYKPLAENSLRNNIAVVVAYLCA
jgi:hypothetical protein